YRAISAVILSLSRIPLSREIIKTGSPVATWPVFQPISVLRSPVSAYRLSMGPAPAKPDASRRHAPKKTGPLAGSARRLSGRDPKSIRHHGLRPGQVPHIQPFQCSVRSFHSQTSAHIAPPTDSQPMTDSQLTTQWEPDSFRSVRERMAFLHPRGAAPASLGRSRSVKECGSGAAGRGALPLIP